MVGKHIAAVNDGVPEGFVGVINADFCTYAPSLTLSRTYFQFSESIQILLYSGIAMFGWNTVPTLVGHFRHVPVSFRRAGARNVVNGGRIYIVCVGLTGLDHLHCEAIEMIKIVGCVSNAISVDVQ